MTRTLVKEGPDGLRKKWIRARLCYYCHKQATHLVTVTWSYSDDPSALIPSPPQSFGTFKRKVCSNHIADAQRYKPTHFRERTGHIDTKVKPL